MMFAHTYVLKLIAYAHLHWQTNVLRVQKSINQPVMGKNVNCLRVNNCYINIEHNRIWIELNMVGQVGCRCLLISGIFRAELELGLSS